VRATPDFKLTLFCGTPHYMCPDIVKKKEYNGHAADVWALGVILFILITGKVPFFAEFEADLFRKVQGAKYTVPKEVSNEVRNLFRKIFNVDSAKRITAREVS
jgi:serine/threonine protein kinase